MMQVSVFILVVLSSTQTLVGVLVSPHGNGTRYGKAKHSYF